MEYLLILYCVIKTVGTEKEDIIRFQFQIIELRIDAALGADGPGNVIT